MPSWKGAGQGALTGASIASIVPGIGPLIGGGIGALVGGLFGHGGKKKDEAPSPTDITGDLTQLRQNADEDRQRGNDLGGMADPAIATALTNLQAQARGDDASVLGASRGARGRIIDQYDSGRKAAMQFGARGGGLNSAIADSYITEANQLSDVTANQQQAANTQLGTLGAQLAGLGLNADQLANADLGTIIQAVLGQQGIDAQKRGQTMGLWGDIGSAAGNILGTIFGKKLSGALPGGGGGGGIGEP